MHIDLTTDHLGDGFASDFYAANPVLAASKIAIEGDVIIINLIEGVTDYAPLINAALRQPGVVEVRLGIGTFPLSSPVSVPSGANLTGAGSGLTLLQASLDFNGTSPSGVVKSDYRATDIALSDFSVDASKLSPDGLRLNGVFMDEVIGFDISRVNVYNVTGYAHFARGDVNSLVAGSPNPLATSGSWTDCNTYNAQVHFEVMYGDGVTFTNCNATDGDGDISVEAYFHPLVGSRNISFIGCTAFGDGLIGFSLISSVQSMENISIIDCYVEINREGSGYGFVDHSGLPTLNLQIENSTFISHDYIGFSAAGIVGYASNSNFRGGIIGINIENLNDGTAPDFDIIDSNTLALRDPNIPAGIVGLQAVTGVSYIGGAIEARGSGGLMFPAGSGGAVSSETKLIQDGFDTRVAFNNAQDNALLFPLVSLPVATFGSFSNGTIAVSFQNYVGPFDSISIVGDTGVENILVSGNQISYGGNVIGHIMSDPSDSGLTIALTAAANETAVGALLRRIAYSSGGQNPGAESRLIEVLITDGGGIKADFTSAVHMSAIQGGLARDVYIVNNTNAMIYESFGYGIDEVRTTLSSYTLPDNIDDLIAMGTNTTSLRGNAIDNKIIGISGSNNINLRDGGHDFATGGDLSDYFYFRDTYESLDTVEGLGGYDFVILQGVYNNNLSGSSLIGIESLYLLSSTDNSYGGSGSIPTAYSFTVDNTLVSSGATLQIVASGLGVNEVMTFDGSGETDGRFTIYGGSGDDQLIGGSGDDNLNGGTGADTLSGGSGNDVYYVDAADTVSEAAGAGYDAIYTSQSFALAMDSEIEFLGTIDSQLVASINLTGNAFANTIVGNSGNNVLAGDDGNDHISGLAGNDVLNGGQGSDILIGGEGNDVYYVEDGDIIIEIVGAGQDKAFSSTNYTLTYGVSIEVLSTTDDVGIGTINLTGNEFKNFMTGNNGANILSGGAAKDKMNGRGGDDILIGGEGADRMTGGAGADIFRYETETDATLLGFDWITDFSDDDTIDLYAIDADSTVAGDQAFSFIGNATFGQIAGQLRTFQQTPGNWMIEADLNGDGIADFAIQVTLEGLTEITSADFIL